MLEVSKLTTRLMKHWCLCSLRAIEKDGAVVQALRARRQIILDNIRDNDEAGINYQKEIAVNEKHRCQLQDMIEEAISNNSNRTYLRILSQYRLLGMANTELQFEMAIRDQVIHNQRVTHRNLWNLLMGLGPDQRKIMELAAKQGISIEDWNSPTGPSVRIEYSPIQGSGRFSPICSFPGIDPQASASTACFLQHHQDFSSMASFKGQRDGHTVCREEHRSSYYLLSHEHTSPAHHGIRKQSEHWAGGNPVPCFYTPEKLPHDPYCCYSGRRALSFPWSSESCTSLSSFHEGYSRQQKDVWPENGQLLPEGASVAASSNLNPCKEIAGHSGAIRSLFQNSSFIRLK